MTDPLRAEIERLAKLEVLAWNLENPGCSREWCAKLLRDFIQRERTALRSTEPPAPTVNRLPPMAERMVEPFGPADGSGRWFPPAARSPEPEGGGRDPTNPVRCPSCTALADVRGAWATCRSPVCSKTFPVPSPSPSPRQVPAPFEPKGIRFYDAASGRAMLLSEEPGSPTDGWIHFRHPDGQWVTLRKATADDLSRIVAAPSAPWPWAPPAPRQGEPGEVWLCDVPGCGKPATGFSGPEVRCSYHDPRCNGTGPAPPAGTKGETT